MKYRTHYEINYYSERYKKHATVPKGYVTDGATGAIDIQSEAWKVHDWLKGNWMGEGPRPLNCRWDDGTKCSNLQASWVIYDILLAEGRWIRARGWFTGTLLWGEGVKLVSKLKFW